MDTSLQHILDWGWRKRILQGWDGKILMGMGLAVDFSLLHHCRLQIDLVVVSCAMHAGGRWVTVAEVSAPVTTASVSLYTLDSPYEYMFRVFAVSAQGLGHASPESDTLLISGDY